MVFFFLWRDESLNLSLHSGSGWDGGNAMWPSTGRGRQRQESPAPLGNRPPREETPPAPLAETVMLHFPRAAGPAPHPLSGSRRCKSWAKALGGKEGGGRRAGPPPAHTIFQAALPFCALTFPSHAHPAPLESQRQTDPRLPGITPPRCTDAPGHHGPRVPAQSGGTVLPQHPQPQKVVRKDLSPHRRLEAAVAKGTCQRSRVSRAPRWCCRQPGRPHCLPRPGWFGEDSPAESHQRYPAWSAPGLDPHLPGRGRPHSTHAGLGAGKGFASGSAAAARLLRQAESETIFVASSGT